MTYSNYNAKYYANELVNPSASNDTDRISTPLFNAFLDDSTNLYQEICEKLFSIPSVPINDISIPYDINERLLIDAKIHINSTINENQNLKNGSLKNKVKQLDKWADDLIGNFNKEIKDENNKKLKEQMKADIKTETLFKVRWKVV